MIIVCQNLTYYNIYFNSIIFKVVGKDLRNFTPDRWNWSQRAEKWVYVKIIDGKRHYKYQIEPPDEFLDLSRELNETNEKLMVTTDVEECENLFKKIMDISKRMQDMGKEDI